jgi:hypothetical protein
MQIASGKMIGGTLSELVSLLDLLNAEPFCTWK